MHHVVCGTLNDPAFSARYATPMFRLRHRVFCERLRWVAPRADGLECDPYDDGDARYLLVVDARGQVLGGWRLRPTTRPYMLADIFPQLLHGRPAPCDGRAWEVSRFAVDDEQDRQTRFGLNAAACALLRATAEYAGAHGIERYVMVASAAAERLYRNLGLIVHRFGPPQRIGGVWSVGCWVEVDAHTRRVLLGAPLPLPAVA